MIEIPSDLHVACLPLVWMLGTWQGAGVATAVPGEGLPGGDFQVGQELTVEYLPGQPWLSYSSQTWRLTADGDLDEPLDSETGFLRPGAGIADVELVLVKHTGVVEVLLGVVDDGKLELASRGMLRTETAPPQTSEHRLYGLVKGSLMWVMEAGYDGAPLRPAISAELRRAEAM